MDKNVPKNLIYFIWWNKRNGMLKYNLDLLEQYLHMFDGQRIIKVASALRKDLPAFLKEAELVKNDPVLGEAPHFKESLTHIKGGYTFYGHAKGVSRDANRPLKWWVKQLYKGNLDTPPNLTDYRVSGCFGKLRPGSEQVPVPWHYSGSFYWFTEEILNRYSQRGIPDNIDNRWFTENFPGWLALEEEAEFRLHSSKSLKYNCYSKEFWRHNQHLIP